LNKTPSGIYGLDPLMDGGFNEQSITLMAGSAGTGKTTSALQFLTKGVERGMEGIYITMDESKKQLVTEAEDMGMDGIREMVESEKLVFLEAAGKDFYTFIQEELPELIAQWRGRTNIRIAIDPLTPVLWSLEDRYSQREVVSSFFKQSKEVGTVLCTLEEHHTSGELKGDEIIIPMYLADAVVHLKYIGLGFSINRMLKIVKCRSSWHSEISHPYQIVNGLGLVVHQAEGGAKQVKDMDDDCYNLLNRRLTNASPEIKTKIMDKIRKVSKSDLGILDPRQICELLLEEYGLL